LSCEFSALHAPQEFDINNSEVISMSQILVRNIPEDVKARLQRRAAERGVSLEAEVRELLRAAADEISSAPEKNNEDIVSALLRFQAEHPVDDETWVEFEKNLREVRKGFRMRPVDLGE
jgi:antitoxin FitA